MKLPSQRRTSPELGNQPARPSRYHPVSRSLLVLLGLLAWLAAVASEAEPHPAQGYWSGGLVREGAVDVLHLEVSSSGKGLEAFFYRPVVGYQGRVPVSYREPVLTLELWSGKAALLLDAELGELRGTLESEGDGPATALHLRRTARPPLPPIRQEEALFQNASVQLAGTLVLPGSAPATGSLPAVCIFVQGRSYGTRGQFLPLAQQLARRGVAGLVFDGRGRGDSAGDPEAMTAADRVGDVLAAIQWVSRHRSLDSRRIGLFGHSAGGWIVPEVARRSSRVRWMVLHAGPAESLAEQQGHVAQALMERSGQAFSREDLEAAFDYQRSLVKLAGNDASWGQISGLVETVRGQPWASFVDLPESAEDGSLSFFRRQPYDSSEALRRTRIPVLALYGGADFVVSAQANAARLTQLLEAAGNQDFRIVTFPLADHSLRVPGATRGNGDSWPGRYYQWPRRPAGFTELLFGWILDHTPGP